MILPTPSHARKLVFVMLLLALAASATDAQTPNRAAVIARLDSIASSPIPEGRAAGIALAVVHGRDTLLFKGYGHADVELNVPMPQDAVFEIGSVTKQFTAAAILQLRDEGKLDLDDDITKYLPDYPTGGRKITVRRLLDHTSGIRGATEIPEFRNLQHRGWPRDSLVALFARQPFDFEPGEAMIYNNSAFILLGHIIEKVSGTTYEQYVEERIFGRLGMKASHYCNNREIVRNRANGYGYQGTTLRRAPENDHTWPFSAGSLCSTAGDLVTWLYALHGGRVLSEPSYREMITPARLQDGTLLRYGMGLSVGPDVRGTMLIGHGGSIAGYTAFTGWYPDAQLAVVVLMNSGGAVSPAALAGELAAEVVPWKRPVMRNYTGDLTPLVGRYAGPARGREMSIEITRNAQGQLLGSVNGAAARPLSWEKDLTFRVANTYITFVRPDNNSPATVLRYDDGGGYYILKRRSS